MARILSQNRWPVYTSGTHSDLVGIPHVTGRVRSGAPAIILGYVVEQFHRRVEPVRKDWSWGYAYRPIRGKSSGYSNHASATAVDTNAPRHPLGASGTFTPAQLAQIVAILAECEGTVRWGGTYSGRKDEMHWEINVPPSDPRLARVAAKLGALSPGLPSTGDKPAPTPTKPKPPTGDLTMADIDDILRKLDYISEQIKVTNQTGVNDRDYLQAQLKAIHEDTAGRAAINARNADVATVVQRIADKAVAKAGAKNASIVRAALDAALADEDG